MRRPKNCRAISIQLSLLLVQQPATALLSTRRNFVNGLFRLPPHGVIPTHNKEGESVDPDKFLQQIIGLINTLRGTQLVDKLHEMRAAPHFDSMFVSDILVNMREINLAMPKLGREHRGSEISETIRYCRGVGMSGSVWTNLQEMPGALAHGMDFLQFTSGAFVGIEKSRTNKIAATCLQTTEDVKDGGASMPMPLMPCRFVDLLENSPPLNDLVHFAGARTLFYRNNKFGQHAVDGIVKQQSGIPWQCVAIDSDCNILSHVCGMTDVFDVIVDEDFPASVEAVGDAGFQPHVCTWSEPRKLGVSMSSCILIMRFAKGKMSGEGFRDAHSHTMSSGARYHSAKRNGRQVRSGDRVYGDTGNPFWAQMQMEDYNSQTEQQTPRYRAPMHKAGELQVQQGNNNMSPGAVAGAGRAPVSLPGTGMRRQA